MKQETSGGDVAQIAAARELLSNPVFIGIIGSISEEYYANWLAATDPAKRDDLWNRSIAVREVLGRIRIQAETIAPEVAA